MSTYQPVQRGLKSPRRRLFGERLEARAMLTMLFAHDVDDPVRAIVPTQGDYEEFGLEWLGGSEPFDDAGWTATSGASNAVGYDRGSGAYDSLLGLDVESAMYNASPTVFVRAEFDVADPLAVNVLTLRLRYDDGFIAWLNGAEVARTNASGVYPAWSATANAAHQASTTTLDVFDLTNLASALHVGTNVLAIRGLNANVADDDALFQFTLTGESRTGPPLARDDAASTTENQPVTIEVLANDDEGIAPIAPGTVSFATPPAHGTALANADGTIAYTPTTTFNGLDTFSYTVRDNSTTGAPFAQTLVASNAAVKAMVPTNDDLGTTWRGGNEPFNDSSWMAGTYGVGYDTNTANIDYNPLIGLNVGTATQNVNTTVYMRSTFSIADPADVTALTLRMRYDDGFAAFINGVQVASAFAPTNLAFNSTIAGEGGNGDGNAIVFQAFNVSSFISALRPGTNVLAIQGLNITVDSSDLLMQPELTATVHAQGRLSNAATVTVDVTGVEFAPIARDDAYTMDEGQSVEGTSLPVGAVVWRLQDGGNGHAYLRVYVPATLDWTRARAAVEPLGGHLATITSQAEANFINASFPGEGGGWVGGYQDRVAPDFSEPAGGWRWITGEAWEYTSWGPGEPNEANSILEDFLVINGNRWNDHPDWIGYVPGYYVEFPTSANVLTNDMDADGDSLTAMLVTSPTNGTLAIDADGHFTYTSNLGFIGVDTFTYRASDGLTVSSLATVTLTVNHVPPSAGNNAYAVAEDAMLDVAAAAGVLIDDADTQNHPLTALLATAPAHGELILNADGSFRYRPSADFFGVDSFTYRASDGTLDSAVATVTITVTPVADAPVARHDTFAVAQGQSLTTTPTGVPTTGTLVARNSSWKYRDDITNGSAYPVDPQGDRWTDNDYDDVAWPAGGAILGYGAIDFGPLAAVIGYGGNASDKYRTALFRRTFHIANADRVTSLAFAALIDDGAAIYINGREVLRYNLPGTLGDGAITTNTVASQFGNEAAYVSFTVDPVSFPGLLVDGTNTIAIEVHQFDPTSTDLGLDLSLTATIGPDPSAVGVLANDSDADGNQLAAALFVGPSHGTLQFSTNGAFAYTPVTAFTGVDEFIYRATDGQLFSEPTTVTIVVRSPTTLPEDLNADGLIDAGDVAFLLANYGKPNGAKDIEGDLTGDARISIRDAIRLRNAFTPPPAPSAAAAAIARGHDRAIVQASDDDMLRVDRRVRRSWDEIPKNLAAAIDVVLAESAVPQITARRRRADA